MFGLKDDVIVVENGILIQAGSNQLISATAHCIN